MVLPASPHFSCLPTVPSGVVAKQAASIHESDTPLFCK